MLLFLRLDQQVCYEKSKCYQDLFINIVFVLPENVENEIDYDGS